MQPQNQPGRHIAGVSQKKGKQRLNRIMEQRKQTDKYNWKRVLLCIRRDESIDPQRTAHRGAVSEN